MGFALLTRPLVASLGRLPRWPRYITVWNWCNVLQYVALTVAELTEPLGMPALLVQTAWLVAVGWALWLEWFATKLALDIGGLPAAGLVGLDVMLGLLIVGFTASLG
jgi:hypothetical protein